MVKILVWDSVGNILWGVRLERIHGDNWREKLRADDFAALDAAPQFDELFAGHDVELIECKSLADVEHHIADADFLNLHKVDLPAEVLERGKKLKLVQHLGLDYRGLPVGAARAAGIPAAATPLVNYLVVAEHNWALILNHLKSMPRQRVHMQTRAYVEQGWGAVHSLRLQIAADQTLGLCGFGEIARPMARYAAAFGMRVQYWDIRRFPDLEQSMNVEYVEWDTLWSTSDIVSVQLALNEQTHKIIGAREVEMMKPNALFVNTGRGKLVDQPALTAALQARRIGGAGLDVMYEEPLPVDDPLHALHEDLSYNVTLTPHSAWQGSWTHVRDSLGIWLNVLYAMRGEPIKYRVD
jgi:phosphoglycerate dehydrogenase-like enzyme